MDQNKKILFIGSTRRGFLALESLKKNGANIVAVISMKQHAHEIEQYEKKISKFCKNKKIESIEASGFGEKTIIDQIKKKWKPDLIIVVGCRVIIPEKIYTFPKYGTIAVHDSLLPKYRGFAPLHWAIINGEKESGISLFYLSKKMDEGDLIDQTIIPIQANDTIVEIYNRTCVATNKILVKNYKKIFEKKIRPKKQNHKLATYGCSRSPDDGLIDWSQSSEDIFNLIRALTYPFPGAFTYYQGKKLYIWQAKLEKDKSKYVGRIPGKITRINQKEKSITVLTKNGEITILRLGFNNKQRVPASSIVKSIRSRFGLQVSEIFTGIEELRKKS